MPHALPPHLGIGHFDTAAVADDSLISDRLEFATIALPFLGSTKDSFTEKAISLRAQGPVIDRLRLLDSP